MANALMNHIRQIQASGQFKDYFYVFSGCIAQFPVLHFGPSNYFFDVFFRERDIPAKPLFNLHAYDPFSFSRNSNRSSIERSNMLMPLGGGGW